jgi:hypothetical protein
MTADRAEVVELVQRNWTTMVGNGRKLRGMFPVHDLDQREAGLVDICAILGVDLGDEDERRSLVAGAFLYAYLSPYTTAAQDTYVMSSLIACVLGKGAV